VADVMLSVDDVLSIGVLFLLTMLYDAPVASGHVTSIEVVVKLLVLHGDVMSGAE